MPRRRDDQTPRDPQQIINDQAREIERLREDLKRSETERQRLRRENERLKEDLEAARRHATRQAAPFSRGLPKAHPQRPVRKPGAAYGHKASASTGDCRRPLRRAVRALDRQVFVVLRDDPLPTEPAAAGRTRPGLVVHEFRVAVGQCTRCQRRVQGRHPLQTSDALGAAAVHLGPQGRGARGHSQ